MSAAEQAGYAYLVNGARVPDAEFYRWACNPSVPVVIEACAGAGKTWMLVSRIVRALLEGAEPSQVLAITFTRKAAGEMRERLQSLLRELASLSHEAQVRELALRGLSAAQAEALAPGLAPLYRRLLASGEQVQVSTIHGWFSKLLRAAPLDTLSALGLPPQLKLLTEEEEDPWPRIWSRWLRDLQHDDEVRPVFMALVADVGRFNLEAWLQAALAQRLEIQLADEAGTLWGSVPPADEALPEWAGVPDPVASVLQPAREAEVQALARTLGALGGTLAPEAASTLIDALQETDAPRRFEGLCRALLKEDGTPRRNITKKPEVLALLSPLQDWLCSIVEAQRQNESCLRHQRMVALARSLFDTYARFKQEGGYIDMVDLERGADHLLRDESLSAWVQQRLDQQLRHVLMDEFQDTSPLQWRALREWLSSYGGAGGGGRIQVFIVGDPKQSIYRFRRAEPRVFQAAKAFVQETLGGAILACDHTRRNAQGLIDALNRSMQPLADAGRFAGFRPHTTASALQAQWRVLPDVMRPTKDERAAARAHGVDGWRDSLTQPRHEPEEVLRAREAAHVADAIAELVVQGRQPQDIFVLARKRQSLLLAAEALAARGIAHAAPNDTLLVDTAEARDLLAVLQAVVSPVHDLSLAHALKTPGLDVGEAGLLALAERARQCHPAEGGRWWEALRAEVEAHDAAPMLASPLQARLARAWSLLRAWRRDARWLPPHDLMQRIVDDCQWREALASQLSPPQFRQAMLHLDAMLAQSLMLRGGRDATPYRWLRDFRKLQAPLPPAAAREAVQLLTIHGAKGLEADVVFLMDTDGQASRTQTYGLMVAWEPDEQAPSRCAFLSSEGRPPASMADWLVQEKAARDSEECNALYVALTRAREMVVVSRTQPARAQPEGSWWQTMAQAGLVGQVGEAGRWQPQPALASVRPGHPTAADGSAPAALAPAVEPNRLPLWPALPPRRAIADTGDAPSASVASAPSVSGEGGLGDADRARLGKAVHRVLEMITTHPVSARTPAFREALARQAWRAVVQEEALPMRLTDDDLQRIQRAVARVLDHPTTARWLDPAQVGWAANELVLWHQGRPVRIDRLVRQDSASGPTWWVLDYKLGESPERLQRYRPQLEAYREALATLVGDAPVQMALIAGNGEFITL
ncbi:DNA helicase UvrD [Aquabacterium lacunae]|uniref:DNA 3'-5' helicase n=1 Tax=Aquabacterium lacunae TaxID=2528630 RepID=A0A4Q9H373_9BURK|nr:UvrD-helicase domain-containing protein [Aquabacterium lacunae]TBO28805.1 DNA helicase UvrD [Aquabacterium lacunae]